MPLVSTERLKISLWLRFRKWGKEVVQGSHTREAFENVGSTLRNARNGRWYSKWKKLYGGLINNCEKAKSYSIWKGCPLAQRQEKQHFQMSGSVEADSPGEKQWRLFWGKNSCLNKVHVHVTTHTDTGNCIKGGVLPWNTRSQNLKSWNTYVCF